MHDMSDGASQPPQPLLTLLELRVYASELIGIWPIVVLPVLALLNAFGPMRRPRHWKGRESRCRPIETGATTR